MIIDTTRQITRKIDQDGVRDLFSELSEEAIRTQLLRRYVDQRIDYDNDTQSVGDLVATEQLSAIDSINSQISELPRKKSFSHGNPISEVSDSNIEAQLCTIVEGATVFASAGLTRHSNGQYITDSVGPTHLASRRVSVALSMLGYQYGLSELHRALSTVVRGRDDFPTIDNAIPLLPLWSNYFHWTIEGLLKLHWKERYERKQDTSPTILIPAQLSSWMRESLSLLGYDATDWTTVNTPGVHIEQLLLPTQIEPVPEHVQWLRSRMLEAVDEPQSGARIYISRRNATKRRVRNEQEVIDALRTRGFEVYILEELSVKEQVELFADAEAVVGPHGAGFANLVYADNPLVIELFGRKRLNTYHRLSTALGLQYEPIYCEARGTDLFVDVDALLGRVNERI